MAAHLDYDTDKRIVYVTTAPTAGEFTLDVKVDIYSDMKEDWRTNATLNKLKFPLSEPVGGNLTKPPDKISPFYFVKYGWSFRPYENDHTLYLENGYLLVAGGGDPWVPTIGAYTVNIRDTVPADSFAIDGGGGGLTAEEIAIAVCDRVLTGATHNIPSSLGRRIRELGDAVTAAVNDVGATTTKFITTLTETRNDFYNDQLIRFTSGNLEGFVRPILDYNGSTKEITVSEVMIEVPDNGIDFDIIPGHVHPIQQIVDGVLDEPGIDHLIVGSHGERAEDTLKKSKLAAFKL